jgi:hypothetical protein
MDLSHLYLILSDDRTESAAKPLASSLCSLATQKQAAASALPSVRWTSTTRRRLLAKPQYDAHQRYLVDAKRWRLGAFKMEVVILVFEAGVLRAIFIGRFIRREGE